MFAKDDPSGLGRQKLHFEVRRANPADLDALSSLVFERQGGERAKYRARFEARLREPEERPVLLVAELAASGEVAAYGSLEWMVFAEDAPADCVPSGWYLTGVIVGRAWQRAGIGAALTRARIEAWKALGSKAGPLRFVVNQTNAPSVRLHAALGFVEERGSGEFQMPGVSFTGGTGLLFRLDATGS